MYRRILNQAFGPGGWALMPRGDTLHYHVIICIVCLYIVLCSQPSLAARSTVRGPDYTRLFGTLIH